MDTSNSLLVRTDTACTAQCNVRAVAWKEIRIESVNDFVRSHGCIFTITCLNLLVGDSFGNVNARGTPRGGGNPAPHEALAETRLTIS